jgi:DNA-binding response OmpR family regulator
METLAEEIVLCSSKPAAGSPGEFRRCGKLKILVIDDEPANAELLEAILMDNGYEQVKAITDSRLALGVGLIFDPDLILLDLMMPQVDGFTILETLRSEPNGASLPVIVLTADESKETKLRVLNAGANDFILKLFDLAEVLLRIENLLALRDRNLQPTDGARGTGGRTPGHNA